MIHNMNASEAAAAINAASAQSAADKLAKAEAAAKAKKLLKQQQLQEQQQQQRQHQLQLLLNGPTPDNRAKEDREWQEAMDGACLGELVPIAKLTRGNIPWRRNRLSPFKVPSRKSHYEARRLELTQQLALFKMEEREMPMTRKDYLLQEGLEGGIAECNQRIRELEQCEANGGRAKPLYKSGLISKATLPYKTAQAEARAKAKWEALKAARKQPPLVDLRTPEQRAYWDARDAAYAAQVERDRIEKERAEAIMLKHGLRAA